MYLPLSHARGRKYYVRISLSKLCLIAVSLPLFAFITCVLLTMYKDFKSANGTHCDVPNIFPSISASIGNYEPQRTIWSTAIYVHAPIRFFIIHQRWKHYINVIRDDFAAIVNIAVLLNVIENFALLGLTFWTSTDYYPYHEFSFKTFIGSSIFYMLFVCMLLTRYRQRPNTTRLELYSVKMKWRMCLTNIGSFAFAAYFFLRHNRLCEPYVYSMFGFSEYIVVISNILYHMTTVYDLPRKQISVTRKVWKPHLFNSESLTSLVIVLQKVFFLGIRKELFYR